MVSEGAIEKIQPINREIYTNKFRKVYQNNTFRNLLVQNGGGGSVAGLWKLSRKDVALTVGEGGFVGGKCLRLLLGYEIASWWCVGALYAAEIAGY